MHVRDVSYNYTVYYEKFKCNSLDDSEGDGQMWFTTLSSAWLKAQPESVKQQLPFVIGVKLGYSLEMLKIVHFGMTEGRGLQSALRKIKQMRGDRFMSKYDAMANAAVSPGASALMATVEDYHAMHPMPDAGSISKIHAVMQEASRKSLENLEATNSPPVSTCETGVASAAESSLVPPPAADPLIVTTAMSDTQDTVVEEPWVGATDSTCAPGTTVASAARLSFVPPAAASVSDAPPVSATPAMLATHDAVVTEPRVSAPGSMSASDTTGPLWSTEHRTLLGEVVDQYEGRRVEWKEIRASAIGMDHRYAAFGDNVFEDRLLRVPSSSGTATRTRLERVEQLLEQQQVQLDQQQLQIQQLQQQLQEQQQQEARTVTSKRPSGPPVKRPGQACEMHRKRKVKCRCVVIAQDQSLPSSSSTSSASASSSSTSSASSSSSSTPSASASSNPS
jgi:hypothetical protein